MADLKSGTPLFFVADNLYPYWEPIPEAYVMDRVFENVLQGEVHSWGHGVPETSPWRWKKKYADDADEAQIDPSTKGSSAGAYLGIVETDSEGTVWIKVNFPFTFYNRDGSNHDTDTTILAWVKSDEVKTKDAAKTIKELESELNLGSKNSSLTGSGTGTSLGLSTNKIVIILAALLVIGLLMFVVLRKKKDPLAPTQPVQAQPSVNLIQLSKPKK